METIKELMKRLEKKNTFWLAWAIMWRMWIISLGFYAAMFLLLAIIS